MKILLAVDGSPCSEAAVEEVAERPWPPGSELKIVTAINAPLVPDPFLIGLTVYEKLMEKQREQAPQLLQEIAQRIQERASDLRIGYEVLMGPPKEVIVEEAERWGADLILIGSHGYGVMKRLMLGSVAHAVVFNAPCSVEVVRRRTAKPDVS